MKLAWAFFYVNMVGGQDELVFDGASCVLNASGNLTHQLPAFEEALVVATLNASTPVSAALVAPLSTEASVYAALTLGLKDYIQKK